ncbi:MAG: hypothetical protein JSU01_23845 [Bacteroidetes bacterium]|nr:hypothetical protein [Bacteroidota bacterium]
MNHVYLVTACHVVNGWLFKSYKKKGAYPDTLFVRVGLKSREHDTVLAIDISMLKQQRANPDRPDIYFIPVNVPSNCEIYKLDSLVLNYVPITKIPPAVLVYGFVGDDKELNRDQFSGSVLKKSEAFVPEWDTYACSLLVYEIGYTNDELGPGDSGAPVYFVTGGLNDSHHASIRFGGLIFGGNSAKHRAVVIRPEIVKAMLNDL